MSTFVALDFETADQGRDSACSLGLVRVENQQIVEQVQYLIRPPRSTFRFTYIHGIRWQDVMNQPSFAEHWDSMRSILQGAEFFAAHNASFDRGVLHHCCDVAEIQRPPQQFVCTVQLARQVWNIRPTKLPNVCEYLGIPLIHHQALSDAQACAQIIIAAQQQAGLSFSKLR